MGVLDDKVAIVTGSARGIGRATAELLLLLREVAHEDGVTVILFTRDIDDAAGVADQIVALEAGRVVTAAAPLAA